MQLDASDEQNVIFCFLTYFGFVVNVLGIILGQNLALIIKNTLLRITRG